MTDAQKLALIQRITELDPEAESIHVHPYTPRVDGVITYSVSIFGIVSSGEYGLITEETI